MSYLSLPSRFHSKTKQLDNGCIEWTAAKNYGGYGRFRLAGKNAYAHRVAYTAEYGPIPDGLVTDHLCRDPSCVNPAHLEAVTQGENILRGDSPRLVSARAAAITHCPHGHEYNKENTYVRKTGGRQCRACSMAQKREQRARAKAGGSPTTTQT